MKNIKYTLFLALAIAFTTTFTLADDGQIPIGGVVSPSPTPNSISAPIDNSGNDVSAKLSNYLQILLSAIKQVSR